MKEWVLLWPGRTFGLFCQQVPCLTMSNPCQSVTKEIFVCMQQGSNAYIHNKSQKGESSANIKPCLDWLLAGVGSLVGIRIDPGLDCTGKL